MPMNVGQARALLINASVRLQQDMTDTAVEALEDAAENYAEAKAYARERREAWRRRRKEEGETVAFDPIRKCRVKGCKEPASRHPVLLFPPLDGGPEPVEAEMTGLDVCEGHSKVVGPECYTQNPYIWQALCEIWTTNDIRPPDPRTATVDYRPLYDLSGVRG